MDTFVVLNAADRHYLEQRFLGVAFATATTAAGLVGITAALIMQHYWFILLWLMVFTAGLFYMGHEMFCFRRKLYATITFDASYRDGE